MLAEVLLIFFKSSETGAGACVPKLRSVDVCQSQQVEQESRSGSRVGIGVELTFERGIPGFRAECCWEERCRCAPLVPPKQRRQKENQAAVEAAKVDCRAGGQRLRGQRSRRFRCL